MKSSILLAILFTIILNFSHISYAQKTRSKQKTPPQINIVGGTGTTIDQQPWQVRVVSVSDNGTFISRCGGSLIGPTTVLTAAHCVNGYTYNQIQVYAGVTNLSQLTTGQIRNASRRTVHPNFISASFTNDLAVIELSSPVNFGANVQPIRYDGGVALANPGTVATASGWGKTCNFCDQSDQLQQVNLTTVDVNTLNTNDYHTLLTGDVVAAGNNLTGVCGGDSGGPLWVSIGGQNFLIGVSSFNPIAGCAANAGIFTRVSSYCQWILQQVSNAANIVGPGTVCDNANYSINNQPLNTNLTWSSSNPSVLSISNNGFATRQNNFNDIVTLTATFSNDCGSGSISRTVTVGPPLVSSILINAQPASPASVCVNNFASVDAVPFDANSSYNWSLSDPGNAYLTNSGSASTAFNAYTANCYELTLQVSNACGFIQRSQTMCAQNCFSRYTVYPNPAQDYITVEFDEAEKADALPDEIVLLDEKSNKPLKTVNVQDTFEKKNFTNGKQIRLDVWELARGTYYLHIKNSRRKDKEIDAIRILLQ